MSSGPHQTNIGWREVRTSRTVTRRLCGHVSGEPSDVFDQSNPRVRAPISPPPAKKSLTTSSPIRTTSLKRSRQAYSRTSAKHNGRPGSKKAKLRGDRRMSVPARKVNISRSRSTRPGPAGSPGPAGPILPPRRAAFSPVTPRDAGARRGAPETPPLSIQIERQLVGVARCADAMAPVAGHCLTRTSAARPVGPSAARARYWATAARARARPILP